MYGHLGYFQYFASMNNTRMDNLVHIYIYYIDNKLLVSMEG